MVPISGSLDTEFPLYVWQTGSGTQSNMNVNEESRLPSSVATASSEWHHMDACPALLLRRTTASQICSSRSSVRCQAAPGAMPFFRLESRKTL